MTCDCKEPANHYEVKALVVMSGAGRMAALAKDLPQLLPADATSEQILLMDAVINHIVDQVVSERDRASALMSEVAR